MEALFVSRCRFRPAVLTVADYLKKEIAHAPRALEKSPARPKGAFMSNTFECQTCGKSFSVPQAALEKYPGWTPKQCMSCRDSKKGGGSSRGGFKKGRSTARSGSNRGASASKELNLTLDQVRERFSEGPHDGLFTDGACTGNPGPGGWGVVHVREGKVLDQRHGHDPQTTNNRMELMALIAAYEMLPADAEETIYSDSNLCVQTINDWAKGWQARGWKRKTGAIKNLELVQRAYQLSLEHPKVRLQWIKAHNGSLWNEYADSLATAYMRDRL
jgi:ribonuclease HI